MAYVDVGPRSAARTLLFLHGNPTWSFQYRNVLRQLEGQFRCVAPDWIGFGLSDRPRGWSYRPTDHADCLRRFTSSVGLQAFTMVVHDWGGPIGFDLALDDPGRVQGFVILNSWLRPPTDNLRMRAFARVAGSTFSGYLIRRFNALVWLMPLGFGDPRRLDRKAHKHYLRAQDGDRQGCAQLPAEFAASRDWLARLWSRRGALDSIPKAFVWGERDRALGTGPLEDWIGAFPDAHVSRLPHTGHFVAEEDPDAVVRAIRGLLT